MTSNRSLQGDHHLQNREKSAKLNFMPSRWLAIVFLGCALLCSLPAFSDELAQFQYALNAYDSGDYKAAIERFSALKKKEAAITNKALLVEIHKYLGASYMFTGKAEGARKEFMELLLLQPGYELDPVLFPTEVLDEFWAAKKDLKDELKKIEEDKKKKEKELKEKKKKLKDSWNMLVSLANNPPYIQRTVKKSNLFFAFLPFGAGQLQNGHNTKGYLFLAGEAVLLIANVTLYWVSYYYDQRAMQLWPGHEEDPRYDDWKSLSGDLGLAANITLFVLLAAVVGGIVDALICYKKVRITYKAVDGSEIPEEYRAKPMDVPYLDLDEILGEDRKDESE